MFSIDNTYTFDATPNQSGELICFANDADGLYYDNSGSVTVTITRLSWPPTVKFDDTYSKNLLQSLENPSAYDEYTS